VTCPDSHDGPILRPEFTEEELDFILNYDIKYRMGHATEEK